MSETLVYTLRLWRTQTQFRAALRAVGEERTELFTEPAAVTDFLRRASAAQAADDPDPDPDPDKPRR